MPFYSDLLVHLAELRAENPDYAVMLRGQQNDYCEDGHGTILRPKAFRQCPRDLKGIATQLKSAAELLSEACHHFSDGVKSLLDQPLIAQAVMQH